MRAYFPQWAYRLQTGTPSSDSLAGLARGGGSSEPLAAPLLVTKERDSDLAAQDRLEGRKAASGGGFYGG